MHLPSAEHERPWQAVDLLAFVLDHLKDGSVVENWRLERYLTQLRHLPGHLSAVEQ